MNRLRTLEFSAVKRGLAVPFIVLTLWVFTLSGCATQQQVKDIVAESNAALVSATLLGVPGGEAALLPYPGTGGDPAGSGNEPWLAPCAKIDAFIEAHPDQKVSASALRVRQGILLLSYKQYNLARAAFEMADPKYLTTARDKALYSLRAHLIWWFRLDKTSSMSLAEFGEADKALEALQTQIGTLGESPGIRDYLAEMRVWIALSAALQTVNKARAKEYFENGMNDYAEIFTAEDLEVLKKATEPSEWDVSIEAVRRRLRSGAVIKYAKDVISQQGIVPDLRSPVFSELVRGAP